MQVVLIWAHVDYVLHPFSPCTNGLLNLYEDAGKWGEERLFMWFVR